MKASVKFRDEQKPLFRAKVPLNIRGFPFQSGIVAGESKELSFNLTSFFESGLFFKVAYRPYDSKNPFSVVFKIGTGHFGSPISSLFKMSAGFNLTGGGKNPSFFLHFKPRLADFVVKEVQSSVFKKQITGDAPLISDSPLESISSGLVKGVLSDVELTATTAVPLRENATLSFRWGVRVPATEDSTMVQMEMNNSMAGISLQKLPCLIINKIGIECKNSSKVEMGPAPIDAAEAFQDVKKQLEIVQSENGELKKAMDNLKDEYFYGLEITEAENVKLKNAVNKLQDEFKDSVVGNKRPSMW